MDLFFIVFLVVCAFVALVDFLIYKIPNEVIVFLFALFFTKVLLESGFDWSVMKTPLMVFGVTFFVCFVLYAIKMLGAGDAKFIAVVSLWVVDYNALLFFIFMALAGGILGLIYLKADPFIERIRFFLIKKLSALKFLEGYLTEKKKTPTRHLKSLSKITIPYGVAVFAGVLLMLNFY